MDEKAVIGVSQLSYYYEDRFYKNNSVLATNSSMDGVAAHFHANVEIMYLREGKYISKITGNEYTLNAGDLLVVFPYHVHEYLRTEFGNKETVVFFSPNLFPDFSKIFETKNPTTPIIKRERIPNELIYELDRITNIKINRNTERIRKFSAGIILSYIFQLIEVEPKKEYNINTVQKLVRYCCSNCLEQDISLESIAEYLGSNKYSVSRIFSKEFGTSFKTFINSQRIDNAKVLLINTSFPIVDIAISCGFNSVRTFDRIFSNYENISPSEYRIKHKK